MKSLRSGLQWARPPEQRCAPANSQTRAGMLATQMSDLVVSNRSPLGTDETLDLPPGITLAVEALPEFSLPVDAQPVCLGAYSCSIVSLVP